MASDPVDDGPRDPYQQWLGRIQRVMKEQGASGWITVRATPDERNAYDNDYDYDDGMSEDEDDSGAKGGGRRRRPHTYYTPEEVDHIRCVLLTPERERAVDRAARLVLGERFGRPSHVAAPVGRQDRSAFASDVLAAYVSMESNFKKMRLWSRKFNLLFGFTLAIQQCDSWSSEKGTEEMVDGLVGLWTRLMKRGSVDLEIDDEFTRPGVEFFYRKFRDNFGSSLPNGNDPAMDLS